MDEQRGDSAVEDAEALNGPVGLTDEQLLNAAANKPSALSDEEKQSTLDWFLDDGAEGSEIEPLYRIQIDVSTNPEVQDFKDWVIKPVPSERIDYLRRQFSIVQGNRDQRRRRGALGTELDAAKFNGQLVFEATADPDLEEVMRRKPGAWTAGWELVVHRFRFKPLLVDQIAGQILTYSGGDDEAVRTATEIKAAGN